MWTLDVPTGDTTEKVQEYYDYLYAHYLDQFSQQLSIDWGLYAWVALWVVVLAGGFYAYTRLQRHTHARREPYPVESYDGYIQETNGPVGGFLWIVFIAMFLWAVILTVLHIRDGQIY